LAHQQPTDVGLDGDWEIENFSGFSMNFLTAF
jgi:hypothetical protein